MCVCVCVCVCFVARVAENGASRIPESDSKHASQQLLHVEPFGNQNVTNCLSKGHSKIDQKKDANKFKWSHAEGRVLGRKPPRMVKNRALRHDGATREFKGCPQLQK